MKKEQLINKIKGRFLEEFSSEPITTFAPGRINIIGEHTDYNEGFVLPAAIDKGIVCCIQKSENKYSTIIAVDVNDRLSVNLDIIQPIENGGWKNYALGVIGEVQKLNNSISNFDLVFGGNIPLGGGMSSSAALENSIGFALNELFNLNISRLELTKVSQRADHNYVGVKSGVMDHFASMFGKSNSAMLLDCRSLEATYYDVFLDAYQIVLINTNVAHTLASSAYNDRRETCEKVASLLSKLSLRDVTETDIINLKFDLTDDEFNKAHFIIQENDRVQQAAKAIKTQNLIALGHLLYSSHDGLQHKYNVSCPELDFLVDYTRTNEAVIGARMMGGGFGGCTINLIHKLAVDDFVHDVQIQYKQKFNTKCSIYFTAISQGAHLI